MSIQLGRNPYKAHDVFDDVESCLWVFLHAAIHFFESNASYSTLDMFDHSEEGRHATYGSFTKGGTAKRNYLFEDEENYVKFSSTALHKAVSEAAALVRYYHLTLTGGDFREHLPSAQQLLIWDPSQPPVPGSRTPLLRHLAQMLERNDWPASDTVSDIFPRIRETVLTKDNDKEKSARVGSTMTSQSLPMQSLKEVLDERNRVAAASGRRRRKRSAEGEGDDEPGTGGSGTDKRQRTLTGSKAGVATRRGTGSRSTDVEPEGPAQASGSRETRAAREQAPLPRRSTRKRSTVDVVQQPL